MDDLNLVALSPAELAPTQTALSAWCAEKQKAIELELADLEEHRLLAVSNGWKLRGLEASINRAAKRVTYYEKMKAAVDAGYLLVPNFPVTLLAVRVDREKQRQSEADWASSRAFEAKPELLPAGEGRYVDDRVFTINHSYEAPNNVGTGTHTVQRFVSDAYDAPDFPFIGVKPAVLAAADRAMALRLFDTIGMVENNSGRDPILVGQLIDPRGNGRRATFFLAWWLNTADL